MDQPEPASRNSIFRRAGHYAAAAVRRPFNPWFHLVNSTVVEQSTATRDTVVADLHTVEHELSQRVESTAGAVVETVRSETEAVLELARAVDATAARTADELSEIVSRMASLEQYLGVPVRLDHDELAGMRRLVGRPLSELPAAAAELVNWATGALGMLGESGYYMNSGFSPNFVEGGVESSAVNERVIELPWAHASAWQLPPGSRVVDVGAAESLLSLELAVMGHRAIALDPRGYPFRHPNLEIVAQGAEAWTGPSEPVAAVFAISTVEHLGLGHYVDASPIVDLDRVAMQCFATWLAKDGQLFLTVPFGRWEVTPLQRIYDRAHLDTLTEGWKALEQRWYRPVDATTWVAVDDEAFIDQWPSDRHGVAVMRLAPLDG